jgi:hypothetical protein
MANNNVPYQNKNKHSNFVDFGKNLSNLSMNIGLNTHKQENFKVPYVSAQAQKEWERNFAETRPVIKPITAEAKNMMNKYNINPNEQVKVNLGDLKPDAGFIPQHMLRGLSGKAAGYAISQGDFFGGVTFLAEGVRNNAFYFDPASGSKGKGILINTHPGITLKYQKDYEIRKMFNATTLAPMTNEILNGVKSGTITPRMKAATLVISDYYNMFNQINGKYSAGADNAIMNVIGKNKFARDMLSHGATKSDVLREVKRNLPAPSYAVLQHLAYKYGNGGINRFTSLLDKSISAALDKPNQDKHLEEGAKFIVYHYRDKNNRLIQDTRAMNIHRLFYVSGLKFSPDLNMKIVTGMGRLDEKERAVVNEVTTRAGIKPIIDKDGQVSNFPDGPAHNSNTKDVELVDVNKPVKKVDYDFSLKMEQAEKAKPSTTPNTDLDHMVKPKTPKPSNSNSCTGICQRSNIMNGL